MDDNSSHGEPMAFSVDSLSKLPGKRFCNMLLCDVAILPIV